MVALNVSDKRNDDFDSIYKEICDSLEKNGTVESLSKEFGSLRTDSERMRFILERAALFSATRYSGLRDKDHASKAASSPPSSPSVSQHSQLFGDLHYEMKSRQMSLINRNLGNNAYQKGQWRRSLDYYSLSILYAPHPSGVSGSVHTLASSLSSPTTMMGSSSVITQVGQGQGSNFGGGNSSSGGDCQFEELSLGYANRSAVLFQLNQYKLCLRDIGLAFDHSYPNGLMHKLFERKARVLYALGDLPRALDASQSAQMWIKYANDQSNKIYDVKRELTKFTTLLQEKVNAMNISEFTPHNVSTMMSTLEEELQKTPNCHRIGQIKEDMKDKTLAEMPGASNKLELIYNAERGRHLVATQDISPGEVLIVETPYSAILLPEYYPTHCQQCLGRLLVCIPCWSCAKVRFCSEKCRSEAWDRFHKVECHQLNLLLELNMGKNALLAMRILTSSGKIYLDYIVRKINERNLSEDLKAKVSTRVGGKGSDCLDDDLKTPGDDNAVKEAIDSDKNIGDVCTTSSVKRTLGFTESSGNCLFYDSQDYRTVYTLIGNTSSRSVSDLFKRSIMSLHLLGVLLSTPFFFNGGSDPRNVTLTDKLSMGSILLTHLQNLPCNAHEINEMELLLKTASPPKNNEEQQASSSNESMHEIGASVYPILSLLNHSCDPNVVRHYHSQTAVVRAIRKIKKGQEIVDNYGYHYAVMEKDDRIRHLKSQYMFDCGCEACEHDWRRYSPDATGSSNIPGKKSSNNAVAIPSKKAYKKAFETACNFSSTCSSFDELCESLEQVEPVLLRRLSALEESSAKEGNTRPTMEHNECQEAVKRCWSLQANVVTDRLFLPSNVSPSDALNFNSS